MKTEPKLYGPETAGYAILNEAIRRGQVAMAPASKRPKRKSKVSAHEKPA